MKEISVSPNKQLFLLQLKKNLMNLLSACAPSEQIKQQSNKNMMEKQPM